MSDQQHDSDGVWRQAIQMPFYTRRRAGLLRLFSGWQYTCFECGHGFRTEQAYRDHYRSDHPEASDGE